MHDTAYAIGRDFLALYGGENISALELGAMNVNGGLRDFARPDWRYLGADIEPGPGVDVVVEKDAPLPFADNQFDLIMASSVLEHDPFFWETFTEIARICRPGGHIYLNVPSNGAFHRFPSDYWRFYPEAGEALSQWATRRGHDVVLVESFIAERDADHWNDFVGIFRKGLDETPPSRFLHETTPCRNVVRLGGGDVEDICYETQDMRLLDEARAQLQAAQQLVGVQESLLRMHEARVANVTAVEGHVDILEHGLVVGWALAREALSERISILVTRDGAPIAAGLASLHRPDLAVLQAGAVDYAFSIPLIPKVESGEIKVWAIGPWGRQALGEIAF